MIENEQQYHVTKSLIQRFEETLENFVNDIEDKRQENPLLFELQMSATESRLADLREELAEYEAQTTYPSNKRLSLESRTMDVAVKDNFMEINSSGKLKIIEEVIKNLTDKITFSAFTSTSLISGGVIFLIYFSGIGYMPELEISSAIILLGASAITGGLVYILLSVFLFLPGIAYAIYTEDISKNSLISNKNKQTLKELLVDNKNNQAVGFIRLSIASIILLIPALVLLVLGNNIWYFILITLSSFFIEFLIFYTLCKKKITLHKIQALLMPLGCVVFVFIFFAVLMTCMIVFSEGISSDAGSISNENLLRVIAIVFFVVVIIISFNTIFILDFDPSQSASKIIKYSLLAFITLMLTTSQLGGFATISKRMVEIYG